MNLDFEKLFKKKVICTYKNFVDALLFRNVGNFILCCFDFEEYTIEMTPVTDDDSRYTDGGDF